MNAREQWESVCDRNDPEALTWFQLHAEQSLRREAEEHRTPRGGIQQFIYCYCRKESQ